MTDAAEDIDIAAIEAHIRRCRRLAAEMTDDKVRLALERLAREYEEQLPKHRRPKRPFMLSD